MARVPQPLTAKLEKEWDADLFSLYAKRPGLAPRLGWESYHTLRSRGSASGYPDRTLWKSRVLFVELKRELTGKKSEDENRRPKPAQVRILDGLAKGGAEVYLWRPSDLDEIALILGRPWSFVRFQSFASSEMAYYAVTGADFPVMGPTLADGSRPPHLESTRDGPWVPRSIWVPGIGRADEAGIA